MEVFNSWWGPLSPLNHWFFIAAAFFSVFFIWQLFMAVLGLGGGEDLDAHVDVGAHDTPADASETLVAFKLVSVRSILAFFTLFTWGGALYMSRGVTSGKAMCYGILWGLAAMVVVAILLHLMLKLTSSGNMRLGTCVGTSGSVYLDIPANGPGEIRVLCNGVMTHLKARIADGAAAKAGTPVKVTKVIGSFEVEVAVESESKN